MCMTLHASKLSSTKIYAGETKINGVYHHVLAYKNKAQNKARGPNAMVLPIPTKHVFGPENAYDTRAFKGFLDDICDSTKAQAYGRRDARKSLSRGLQVFDVGSYTVVVGTKMGEAMSAVASLPVDKRPEMNPSVLSAMAELYPGWAFAFCIWNSSQVLDAEPILFAYEPIAPSLLFAPALDAHDGNPPGHGDVDVDHIVSFGSTLKPTGTELIKYRTPPPDLVRNILPTHAVGQRVRGRVPNGDFWYETSRFTGDTKHDFKPGPMERFFPRPNPTKTSIPLNNWS
jgi:hypothetical protein